MEGKQGALAAGVDPIIPIVAVRNLREGGLIDGLRCDMGDFWFIANVKSDHDVREAISERDYVTSILQGVSSNVHRGPERRGTSGRLRIATLEGIKLLEYQWASPALITYRWMKKRGPGDNQPSQPIPVPVLRPEDPSVPRPQRPPMPIPVIPIRPQPVPVPAARPGSAASLLQFLSGPLFFFNGQGGILFDNPNQLGGPSTGPMS